MDVAVKQFSTGGLVGPAGEVKDYHSDEDSPDSPDERPIRKLKPPPLKKKSSVAMDLLVKNLVGYGVVNSVSISACGPEQVRWTKAPALLS